MSEPEIWTDFKDYALNATMPPDRRAMMLWVVARVDELETEEYCLAARLRELEAERRESVLPASYDDNSRTIVDSIAGGATEGAERSDPLPIVIWLRHSRPGEVDVVGRYEWVCEDKAPAPEET